MKRIGLILSGLMLFITIKAQTFSINEISYRDEMYSVKRGVLNRVLQNVKNNVLKNNISVYSDSTYKNKIENTLIDSLHYAPLPRNCYSQDSKQKGIMDVFEITINNEGVSFLCRIECKDTVNNTSNYVNKVLFFIKRGDLQNIKDSYSRSFFIDFMYNYGYVRKSGSSYNDLFDWYFFDLYRNFLYNLRESDHVFFIVPENISFSDSYSFNGYAKSDRAYLQNYTIDSNTNNIYDYLDYVVSIVQLSKITTKKGKTKRVLTNVGFAYSSEKINIDGIYIPREFIMTDLRTFYNVIEKDYAGIFDLFYDGLLFIQLNAKLSCQ